MKILISTDIEGIAGVDTREAVYDRSSQAYDLACTLMTSEVRHVVEICQSFGHEVFIVDAHGSGTNIVRRDIPGVRFISKDSDFGMMGGIDSVDAVIMVGYHAMAGVEDGFCAHTNSSRIVKSVEVNGIMLGEAGLNLILAKHLSKKVLLITGTNEVRDELATLNSDVPFICTKESISRELAKSFSKSVVYSKMSDVLSKPFLDESLTDVSSDGVFHFKIALNDEPSIKLDYVVFEGNVAHIKGSYLECYIGFRKLLFALY